MKNPIYHVVASLATSVIACGIGASLAAASPATDALEHLNNQLNAAQSLSFSATVTSPSKNDKASPTTYSVAGTMQKPNLLNVTVSQISGSIRDGNLPATISCDGTKYTVFAKGLGEYSQAVAPSDAYEPDSPDAMYFIYNILGDAGPAALNTAELFFPADFNIADEKLPDGMKRSIVASSTTVVSSGIRFKDITQKVTGAHGTRIYHVMLSPTGTFSGWRIDSIDTSGKVANQLNVQFARLTLSSQKLAATQFTAQDLANARPFQTPASPGTDAPEFTADKPDGTQIRLGDYTGKVVVIDFWATWCPPCRKTLPDTDKLAAQYQPKGVVFLPVCTWDTKANFDQWVPAHKKWTMSWVFDPAADKDSDSIATKLYAVAGIPTQYVIGKDGKIVYRGFADSDAGEKPLIDAIDKAIAM